MRNKVLRLSPVVLGFLLASTTEFYAAERKKELLPFATAWMELESIMLSEISQALMPPSPLPSLSAGKKLLVYFLYLR